MASLYDSLHPLPSKVLFNKSVQIRDCLRQITNNNRKIRKLDSHGSLIPLEFLLADLAQAHSFLYIYSFLLEGVTIYACMATTYVRVYRHTLPAGCRRFQESTPSQERGERKVKMSTKRFTGALVSLLLALGLLGLIAPATATADGIDSGSTVSYSSSEVTDETVVTDIATGDAMGKTNLEFIVKDGITYKGKCPTVSKVTSKLLKSKKCFVLKKGKKFVNSGRNRAGKVVYYTDTTKSNTKFIKVNGVWRKANCGNYARFKTYPALKASSVVIVKSFAEVTVTVKVIAKASVTAKAEAWCKSGSSSASGSATATATAEASATATASAKTELEATIKATNSVRVSVLNKVEAAAKAEAAIKATAKAEAKAVCTEVKPTPPPTPAPKLIETDTINDVVVSNSRTITVSGTVAKGHTATLFASAKNGGTISSGKSQTVSGSFSTKVTYVAPDEVPDGGKDWVEFTLTQDDGQVDTASTNKFVITVRPETPK